MSRRGIGRRLERLEEPEVPSRAEYLDARRQRIKTHHRKAHGGRASWPEGRGRHD